MAVCEHFYDTYEGVEDMIMKSVNSKEEIVTTTYRTTKVYCQKCLIIIPLKEFSPKKAAINYD